MPFRTARSLDDAPSRRQPSGNLQPTAKNVRLEAAGGRPPIPRRGSHGCAIRSHTRMAAAAQAQTGGNVRYATCRHALAAHAARLACARSVVVGAAAIGRAGRDPRIRALHTLGDPPRRKAATSPQREDFAVCIGRTPASPTERLLCHADDETDLLKRRERPQDPLRRQSRCSRAVSECFECVGKAIPSAQPGDEFGQSVGV